MPEEKERDYSAYPFVSFHFEVAFDGLETGKTIKGSFQSVEGLKMSMTPTPWKEGGENRFEYHLISRPKYGPLILKRGLFQDRTAFYEWYKTAFQEMEVRPLNLLVSLLDETHQAVMSWNVVHAIPTEWAVSGFDATKSDVVVETMKLSYLYFDRE